MWSMTEIGLQQMLILLMGVSMAAVGILGLTGLLTTQAVLIGAVLVAVAALSFHVGQTYAEPRRV